MFYSLRGTLIHTEPNMAVVECGGVGFQCMTTMSTLRTLPKIGGEVTLYTHLNVREDAMDLFGFSSRGELNCFKMLIAVSGVGPKAGLSILSELAPEQAGVVSASANVAEAVKALTVLGYSATDAASIAAKFDSSLPVEELIRLSLREIATKL